MTLEANCTASSSIDADELCILAGRTVTHLYRTSHPDAAKVDAAHGRVYQRSRARGTISVDEHDVRIIVAGAIEVAT